MPMPTEIPLPPQQQQLLEAMMAAAQQQPGAEVPAPAEGGNGLGRNLGAAAALALGILPATRLGRAMFATAPRAAATFGGLGAAGALLNPQEAEAAPPQRAAGGPAPAGPAAPTAPAGPPTPAARVLPDDPRWGRYDELQREIDREDAALRQLSRTTRDPDRLYTLGQPIQGRISSATARRDAIEQQILSEAATEAGKTRERLAAQAEETRLANRHWREEHTDLARAWPWLVPTAAAAGGGLTAALMRGARFAENIPWNRAVASARQAVQTNNPAAVTQLRELADRMANYAPAAKSGNWIPAAVGGSLGAELGMFPILSDIMNLGFDRAVDNPWELGKAGITGLLGASTGATAGKFVGAALPRPQPPIEASRGLAAQLTPAYEKAANARLVAAMRQPTPAAGRGRAATSEPTVVPPAEPVPPTRDITPVGPTIGGSGGTPALPPPTPPQPPTPEPPPPTPRRTRGPSAATLEAKQQLDLARQQLSPQERVAEVMLAKKMGLTTKQRLEALLQRIRG